MKNVVYFFGSLALAAAAAFLVYFWLDSYGTPGYVLIGMGRWSLETSLIFFTASLIIVFFIFYMFFRLLGWLFRLPGQMKKRSSSIKFNRSLDALIAGLVDSAEGNWEKAEKVLIKHAANSGAPLIHYLTAARAAQSRGAFDKRDEYLQQAASQAPGSDVAIGLTQAELHLSGNQFEQALDTLTRLHSINPTHASVLKLLHQTYQHLGDWEGIRKLLPSLHTNKVLMEAEVKLLETEAFSRLLKQTAETSDAEEIKQRWSEIPDHIKKMHGVPAIYFAAMANAGAGADIESDLVDTLSFDWDDTLLVLFGSIETADADRQLETAEQWLESHQNNALLLSILGKLSIRCQDHDKAQSYLSQSIAIEPTVQAYQLLGDVLFAKGEKDRASLCYKAGLELSSSGVINQIDNFSMETD
ncbi:MAG: heme biosynthesis HemY N-terminal domain-containing protein [Gammaproteobacteria bacterium]